MLVCELWVFFPSIFPSPKTKHTHTNTRMHRSRMSFSMTLRYGTHAEEQLHPLCGVEGIFFGSLGACEPFKLAGLQKNRFGFTPIELSHPICLFLQWKWIGKMMALSDKLLAITDGWWTTKKPFLSSLVSTHDKPLVSWSRRIFKVFFFVTLGLLFFLLGTGLWRDSFQKGLVEVEG